eukprot:TRINITY_DN32868_c0_g1_i1.p1 TRINITY_DN32868_c0_g1~~TRINITY_DN32868_c0_g1_i1.p1  ORF type:complete len:116 (+),score=13.33 TRINITY_DN32868_c0_g1_i1:67-414(+)
MVPHLRNLISVIGDEETVTGFLLAGIGHVTHNSKNFLIVDSKTDLATIQSTFKELVSRPDIAIVIVSNHIADQIRGEIEAHLEIHPAVVEIPSKYHPYDPEKDTILSRVNTILGL